MPLVLLIGGARSGKSEFALDLSREQSGPVVFLATAEAGDAELAARIARHRRERPARWQTVEEPLRLRESIEAVESDSCLVIDCLTLWTSNALARLGAEATETEAATAASAAHVRRGLTVAVTNEVGLGIVPDNRLARAYRDLLGRVNTIWANEADHALLLVAGQALPLASPHSLLGKLQ